MSSIKKNQIGTANAIVPGNCTTTPVKIEKRFATFIFSVTLFIHLFCVIYLILSGIVQNLHTEFEGKIIGIYKPIVTLISHFACAALHLSGAIAACRPNKRKDKDRVFTFNRKNEKMNPFKTTVNYMHSLMYAFSIDGEYFDVGIIILEVVEILAASYQALLMSRNSPHRPAALLFTLLILSNCMITPLIMQSKNEAIKRYLTLLVDGIFDFLYSISFQIWLMVKKGFENYVDENPKVLYNDPFYVTESVYEVKQVFVTSGMTLVFNLFPFVITFVTFSSLTSVVQRDRTCNSTTSSLRRNCSEVKSNGFLNKASYFLTKRVRIVQCCLIVWGMIVSIIAVKALSRDNCHKACVLQVYPWFNTKCMCIGFRINCKTMNISTETMYNELNFASRDLFILEISQCDLSGGPKIQNIQRFEKLFWLNLKFNQIDKWQSEEYFLPKSLVVFHLDGSNLTKLPEALVNNIPQSLGAIFIYNSRISEISTNDSMNWKNLAQFRFRHSLIQTFPMHLLKLPKLKQLDLQFNLISELPVQMESSNLEHLDVNNNQVSTLPPGLFDNLPRLNELFVGGNPINKLPESYQSYIFKMKKFRISQTKLCARLIANEALFSSLEIQMAKKRQMFCPKSCSPKCVAKSHGDNICDIPCYKEICEWDKGDCSRFEL